MTKMIEVTHEDPVLRVFMLFMQVAQAAYKYADRSFYHETRLSTATFVGLKGLVKNGGVMTHSELAAWTNTEKHNITTLVDRMKKEGLVTNEYSQQDRRVAHITVTDKGREVFEEAVRASRKIMNRTMRGIGKDKAVEMEKLLNIMKRNIEREK